MKRLGEICTYFKSGEGITSKDISENGQYPVYGGNGLRGYTDKKYTHDGAYILIGRQGALCGNINYVTGKCYISEHAIAVQTKGDLSWLRYKLDFWNLNRYSESSAQPGLSVEKLVRYKLTVPPLAEQRKIAEVLGVWDEAIEKQARLIEKLALRKRALMQRLLSAKLRLPGFSEPWKKVKLGDVAELYQPQTIQSEDLSQTGYPVYGANGLIGYYNSYNHEYPQVVITCRGSSCGTVNFTPGKCWITGNAMVLNVDNNRDVNKSFFYYLISNSSFVNLISGSGQPQIVRQPLLKFELHIPTLKEQTAIAEVLTAADREIELAKEKLERLRRQKRGLMQQLLTGKKRVHL